VAGVPIASKHTRLSSGMAKSKAVHGNFRRGEYGDGRTRAFELGLLVHHVTPASLFVYARRQSDRPTVRPSNQPQAGSPRSQGFPEKILSSGLPRTLGAAPGKVAGPDGLDRCSARRKIDPVSQLELFHSAREPGARGTKSPLKPRQTPAADHSTWMSSMRGKGDLERLVEAYLLSAIENGNTRRAYRANITRALGLFALDRLDDLTIGHLVAFRGAVCASSLASSSQVQMIFSLRGFLTWADSAVGLPFALTAARSILRAPKAVTVSPPAILTVGEATSVVGLAVRESGMRAMMMVLLGAGLRVTELCNLDCADVVRDAEQGARLRVHGKGMRDRLIPLHEHALAEIETYLRATGRCLRSPGRVFLAHDRGAGQRPARKISARSARRRVGHLLRRAGISKPVRVHGLRHTFSIEVVRGGGSPFHLQKWLGHSSVATTQKYLTNLGVDDLRATIPTSLLG
jgi:site-specific recombinase XerD